MAKISEKYETMVVYSLKNGEEPITALNEKFTKLIKENTELINVDEWGKRNLSYQIDYERDGYYVLYQYDCKPEFPHELERVLGITEGLLRFLTVVREDAPPPSEKEKQSKQEETPPTSEE
ncbi:MAG: 30S ribosomal protein S6 [Oscillospiraceae bacterium]|nr:30S ribosomal protein S6 [Oscillospiraceae bacterium]